MSKPKAGALPSAALDSWRAGSKVRDQLNIRFAPGDLAKLKTAADRERRKLSDWARLVLLDAAAGRKR